MRITLSQCIGTKNIDGSGLIQLIGVSRGGRRKRAPPSPVSPSQEEEKRKARKQQEVNTLTFGQY